jgi:hypothetical protein
MRAAPVWNVEWMVLRTIRGLDFVDLRKPDRYSPTRYGTIRGSRFS